MIAMPVEIEQLQGIKPGTRVVAAMSGGVDSSVAAALLQEAGCEVIGVMMQLYPKDLPLAEPAEGGCCSLEAAHDARRVADRLGIPFYLVNFEEVFTKEVIERFAGNIWRGGRPTRALSATKR